MAHPDSCWGQPPAVRGSTAPSAAPQPHLQRHLLHQVLLVGVLKGEAPLGGPIRHQLPQQRPLLADLLRQCPGVHPCKWAVRHNPTPAQQDPVPWQQHHPQMPTEGQISPGGQISRAESGFRTCRPTAPTPNPTLLSPQSHLVAQGCSAPSATGPGSGMHSSGWGSLSTLPPPTQPHGSCWTQTTVGTEGEQGKAEGHRPRRNPTEHGPHSHSTGPAPSVLGCHLSPPCPTHITARLSLSPAKSLDQGAPG